MWFGVVAKFMLHCLAGTVVFTIIAIPALLLQLLMTALAQKCSGVVIALLQIAEYALLAVDLALFLVFLVRAGLIHGSEIWRLKPEEAPKRANPD